MRTRHRTLWKLTAGHRLRYGAAVAALAAGTLLLFAVPLVTRRAIDRVAAGTADGRALALAAAAVVGLTALAGACAYLRGRWAAIASEGIVRGLRERLHDHLQRLPAAFHDRADTGDLVQRSTSDVETVRLFLAVQTVEVGRAALMLAAVTPLMLALDAAMTLASLALFPVVIGFALVFFRRVQDVFLHADRAEAAMTTVLHENLTGIRVVRAFAREAHEEARFARANALHRDRYQGLIRVLAAFWATCDLLCASQVGIALLVGAVRLRGGQLSPGTLFAFLSYVYLLIGPVKQMGRILADMGKAEVALGRIGELLSEDEEGEGADAAGAPPAALAGSIEVEGLSFAHGAGPPVLADVSFRVRPGETLALLGPPGAGKSTLVHLLLRLYDYERGSIRLDGRELRTLPRGFVRAQVGAVLQEPFLYSKSVRENLKVARAGASDAEVEESARTACLHDAIVSFERGYDTLVGERGVTLSGGQRQRLALARALLKDPPVLVLDDALSAVDTGTEAQIRQALRARRGRRTTIVIAHRLSTLEGADRILVLERGRVVQAGTHEELLASEGLYRRLWRLQGALERSIEEEIKTDDEDGGEHVDGAA